MSAPWKPILSCPGYFASADGSLWSAISNRLIYGSVDRYGYRNVNLIIDGKPVKRKVHRLICEAFSGPCPEGRECGHLNGTKTDNRAKNLAWITRSENMRHQILHGTFAGAANLTGPQKSRKGEDNPFSKLTVDDVLKIRARSAKGESGRSIARDIGANQAHVAKIILGHRWGHVPLRDGTSLPPFGLQSTFAGAHK